MAKIVPTCADESLDTAVFQLTFSKLTLLGSCCCPQEPTTDGFEWTSDSPEAIDRVLYVELGAFALVDAVEMKFPAGDTYKFDLVITDGKVWDEPINTIEVKKASNLARTLLAAFCEPSKLADLFTTLLFI